MIVSWMMNLDLNVEFDVGVFWVKFIVDKEFYYEWMCKRTFRQSFNSTSKQLPRAEKS